MSNPEVDAEAELALIALADPVSWRWETYKSSSNYREGYWLGDAPGVGYRISSPHDPDEVDAGIASRSWTVYVHVAGSQFHSSSFAPTAEAAKGMCTRHALTGDMQEMTANAAVARAQADWYSGAQNAAASQLSHFNIHPLSWRPVEAVSDKPLHFAAQAERGSYEAQWMETRRWVVTFRPRTKKYGARVLEHCFITRKIAEFACAVHINTGRWVGVLTKGDYLEQHCGQPTHHP